MLTRVTFVTRDRVILDTVCDPDPGCSGLVQRDSFLFHLCTRTWGGKGPKQGFTLYRNVFTLCRPEVQIWLNGFASFSLLSKVKEFTFPLVTLPWDREPFSFHDSRSYFGRPGILCTCTSSVLHLFPHRSSTFTSVPLKPLLPQERFGPTKRFLFSSFLLHPHLYTSLCFTHTRPKTNWFEDESKGRWITQPVSTWYN